MSQVRYVVVAADGEGQRVDNYLLKILKKVPKSRIYRMLRTGEVRVDGKRVLPVFRLEIGQTLRIPPVITADSGVGTPPPAMLIDSLERRVLYEGQGFLVIDKPAGVAVHAGSGVPYGVVEAFKASRGGFLELVHRLDRDTSGLLLLADQPETLRVLQDAFRQRSISKSYRAVVTGRLEVMQYEVNMRLRKYLLADGERRVRVDASEGREAITELTTLMAGSFVSTVEAVIHTGRTHQIRVHLAALGHPVVGDDKYGDSRSAPSRAAGRLLLHAHQLEFDLLGQKFSFEAPIPPVFDSVQNQFRQ